MQVCRGSISSSNLCFSWKICSCIRELPVTSINFQQHSSFAKKIRCWTQNLWKWNGRLWWSVFKSMTRWIGQLYEPMHGRFIASMKRSHSNKSSIRRKRPSLQAIWCLTPIWIKSWKMNDAGSKRRIPPFFSSRLRIRLKFQRKYNPLPWFDISASWSHRGIILSHLGLSDGGSSFDKFLWIGLLTRILCINSKPTFAFPRAFVQAPSMIYSINYGGEDKKLRKTSHRPRFH